MDGGIERTYDIFELLTDSDLEWRDFAEGHDAALARARELAAGSKNEFRVMHLPTNTIVAVFNAKQSPNPGNVPPKTGEGGEGEGRLPGRWGKIAWMQGFLHRRAASAF